jgi:integrase
MPSQSAAATAATKPKQKPKQERRFRFTDKRIEGLAREPKRCIMADAGQRGLYARVPARGSASPVIFVATARDPHGRQVWGTIGGADVTTVEEAREAARGIIKRVQAGKPAVEAPPIKPDTYQAVAENFIKRYVAEKKLVSQPEIERCLKKYVYPHWGKREFVGIRRTDVAALLDGIVDDHGKRQADMVLAITRKISNWYATRDDKYQSPFVRGMRRTDPGSSSRDRNLSDDELRAVWKAAESSGTFGTLIRMLLLTGQRREKVVGMRRADVVDGAWYIEQNEREKGTAGILELPEAARAIIEAQPKIGKNPFVFAGRGEGHFNAFSAAKEDFDKKLPAMPRWVLHDMRRTARSLMSRAGVSSDIAERVLGHALVRTISCDVAGT